MNRRGLLAVSGGVLGSGIINAATFNAPWPLPSRKKQAAGFLLFDDYDVIPVGDAVDITGLINSLEPRQILELLPIEPKMYKWVVPCRVPKGALIIGPTCRGAVIRCVHEPPIVNPVTGKEHSWAWDLALGSRNTVTDAWHRGILMSEYQISVGQRLSLNEPFRYWHAMPMCG